METPNFHVLLRTLLFTVLVPGTVTVVVPYLLLPSDAGRAISALGLIGIIPIALGVGCYLRSAWDFALRGRGTPAPIDPPKSPVATGPYRYVRNPMYLGVGSVLAGEAMFFSSWRLLAYAALVGTAFYLFVVLYEERVLRKKFGAAYDDYCKSVPRWIPKFRPKQRWRDRTAQKKKIST